MRALVLAVLPLLGCTSENVAPLDQFGPIDAYVDVELGPLAADSGREDVNPRVFVEFSHNNPDCPVFGDVDTSIDGVRPDAFEHGYYDDGSGWGDNHDPSCESPYFTIDKVPPEKPRSIVRLADATASFSLEVDRLFVNPVMTIATPLVRGQLAHLDVADDRDIKSVEGIWVVQGRDDLGTFELGYDVKPTVASGTITFRMPTETSGPGRLEIREVLGAPELSCNGFATCSVSIKGSQVFDATLE